MLAYLEYSQLNIEDIEKLISRNSDSDNVIQTRVEEIILEVKNKGDQALKGFAEKFDNISLDSLKIGKDEIAELADTVNRDQKRALEIAFNNIYKFHITQLIKEKKVETSKGVTCWRENRPIERVGLYIPGGSAVLPSTFLMLGVPARIAGCKEIVVCTPPQADGKINPYIAHCATLLQIETIYQVGGAQAVAAMAYGTESIPKVDKIFGPGNQYVTQAKTVVQMQTNVAIDMPAGPSEVIVIGDETSNPAFVAADLLAQAEHGADSQSVLLSTDKSLIEKVQAELKKQIDELPRAEIARKAIENSYAVFFTSTTELMEFCNNYAPEHLIVSIDKPEAYSRMIINAGSVFFGHLTPESAGDYASGTNHTLPTSAYAKAYSGVSTDSFIKKITFQQISEEGILNLGPTIETLAEIEGLQAHKNAVSIRLKYLQSK